MSYDICLKNPKTGKPIQFEERHQLKGGTYEAGGSHEAWLNVTYNYSEHLSRVLEEKGIRVLYGKTGKDSVPILKKAISKMKGVPDRDYWAATEGNAKKALQNLLALAKMAPQGVWDGD
jgi:hypothetical protein